MQVPAKRPSPSAAPLHPRYQSSTGSGLCENCELFKTSLNVSHCSNSPDDSQPSQTSGWLALGNGTANQSTLRQLSFHHRKHSTRPLRTAGGCNLLDSSCAPLRRSVVPSRPWHSASRSSCSAAGIGHWGLKAGARGGKGDKPPRLLIVTKIQPRQTSGFGPPRLVREHIVQRRRQRWPISGGRCPEAACRHSRRGGLGAEGLRLLVLLLPPAVVVMELRRWGVGVSEGLGPEEEEGWCVESEAAAVAEEWGGGGLFFTLHFVTELKLTLNGSSYFCLKVSGLPQRAAIFESKIVCWTSSFPVARDCSRCRAEGNYSIDPTIVITGFVMAEASYGDSAGAEVKQFGQRDTGPVRDAGLPLWTLGNIPGPNALGDVMAVLGTPG
ncbi:hypothetical protein DFJ73DRAFT_949236 [Zopfochytrium polystomum]|nr:hypothetical protein DFJ73DRAFT_949236 [Zopfochytrium polystomum]